MPYSDLEHKWTTIRESGSSVEAFDLSQATAESFFLVMNDRSGGGQCSVDVTAVGAFEGVADCLAYLRYCQLPEALEWRGTFEQLALADGTAAPPQDELVGGAEQLAARLRALIDSEPDPDELAEARLEWNGVFADTDPGSTILTWGTITDVLVSPYVSDILGDEEHEGEHDDLLAAIRVGEFDACDPARFSEAVEALAEVERS